MTADNYSNIPITFTLELPQELAGKIIQKAEQHDQIPEIWLQKKVALMFEEKEQTSRELLIQELIKKECELKEKAQTKKPQTKTEHPALPLIRTKLSKTLNERERAENKLFDIRHSVQMTEEKKKEYLAEQQTFEKEIEDILDEIIDRPYDKTLLAKLDKLTENLNTAKYNYSLMAAQYEDSLGCFLEQKAEVMRINTKYLLLQSEYGKVMRDNFKENSEFQINSDIPEEKEQEVETK